MFLYKVSDNMNPWESTCLTNSQAMLQKSLQGTGILCCLSTQAWGNFPKAIACLTMERFRRAVLAM